MENKEKPFSIYRKTPLIKTGFHAVLLSESVYLFYNFITNSKPITNFINGNLNIINSNILPLIDQAAKYTHENYISSFLIAAGTGASLYIADKLRTYVPKNEKYHKDGKHFFLQGYIKFYYNKYVKKIGKGLMGISALTAITGGTYNSFIENNLKFGENLSEIVSNYNSLLFTVGIGTFLYSSKSLTTYATNMGRGLYEKYVLLKNALNLNSNEEEIEMDNVSENNGINEVNEVEKETNEVSVKHDVEKDKIRKISNAVKTKAKSSKKYIKNKNKNN